MKFEWNKMLTAVCKKICVCFLFLYFVFLMEQPLIIAEITSESIDKQYSIQIVNGVSLEIPNDVKLHLSNKSKFDHEVSIFKNEDLSKMILVTHVVPESDAATLYQTCQRVFLPQNKSDELFRTGWKSGYKSIEKMENKKVNDFNVFFTKGVRGVMNVRIYEMFNEKNEWALSIIIAGKDGYFLSDEEADHLVSTVRMNN